MQFFWIEQHVLWGHGGPGYKHSYQLAAYDGTAAASLWSWWGPGTAHREPGDDTLSRIAVGRRGTAALPTEVPSAVRALRDSRDPGDSYRTLTLDTVRQMVDGERMIEIAPAWCRHAAVYAERRRARWAEIQQEFAAARAVGHGAGTPAPRAHRAPICAGDYRARSGQSPARRRKARRMEREVAAHVAAQESAQ